MKQIAIVVEGQTEQQFIEQVLAPRLSTHGVYPQAIITKTKRTATGSFRGGGDWTAYGEVLRVLAHQPHWALVTTMIDHYAYPSNAPGRSCHPPGEHIPEHCADHRQEAIRQLIDSDSVNFSPFIMLHEFEALVIASGATQSTVLGRTEAPSQFQRMIREAGSAELINDGPDTAPSKRVARVIAGYSKTFDGIAIIDNGSFDDLLEACPRFAAWYRQLAGL